jgi:RsiW-degrading membrane proteinase PrsW (M82 family)
MIEDEIYLNTTQSMERQIQYVSVLYGALYLLAGVIGFALAWLLLLSRRREIAVMRALGTQSGRILGNFLLEQLLLDKFLPTVPITSETVYFIATAVIVALVEEGTKLFFLKRFTWRSPDFNYRYDGVVYAVFVSLGFAAIENLLYVFQYGLSVAWARVLKYS